MADPNIPAPRTFELTKELLEAAKELILYTSEVQKKTSDTAEAVTKTTRRASKRIAVNATTSMDDIIGAMDKGLEKAGKKAKKQVEDVHAAIRKEQERTEKAQLKSIQTYLQKNKEVKQRSHSIFEALSPEHRGAYGKLLKRKAKNFILGEGSAAGSAALGQIAGFAMKIAPQIAIMLSFAEAVRTVVERFFELDKKTVELSMNLGGDYKTALDIQVHTYGEIVEATNLTKEAVEDMGMAFLQAGIPLTSHKEDLIDYMTVAGNMHKVLGTSFDQLARYTETLRHAGKRAGQMFDEYDAMYQKMEKYQLTVADFNSSLTEGDDLWSEFGSRSNRTLTQLQSDVLQTKGIFKSFNLDVKSTGSLMQAMMGDPRAQIRQAALISAMKGKSHNAAFIDVATGSAQGAQDLIETLVRYATSFKDAHYGESSSQLARLGDGGYASVLKQRGMLENSMSKQFNMSQKMVSQILSDYEGFMGVNPGASIDQWVQKRLKDHQDPSKAGGLMQALKTKENSVESSLLAISNTVMEIADHIAYLALDQSPKFLSAINSVLKFIPNMNISEVLSFDKWKTKRNSAMVHETSSVDRLLQRANKKRLHESRIRRTQRLDSRRCFERHPAAEICGERIALQVAAEAAT